MTCVYDSPAGSRKPHLTFAAGIHWLTHRPTRANPLRSRGRIFLCLPLLILCSFAFAEENIGYYRKVAEDSTSITWEKIWGAHFPEVEDYEMAEGDVVVTFQEEEGSCSGTFPDEQLCAGSDSLSQEGFTTSSTDSEDPAELPPIVVTGKPVELKAISVTYYIRPDGPIGNNSGGSNEFGGTGDGDAIAKPLDSELCDVDNFQNITDETAKRALVSPSTLDGMKDIVEKSENQNAEFFGRIIRNDRSASDAFAVRWESESDFANVVERNCNRVTLSISPLIDFSNSILVHTHPACANSLVGPSQADIDFVRDFGFKGGLIIDLNNDKLISYDENAEPPEENEETGDIEDICGISDN